MRGFQFTVDVSVQASVFRCEVKRGKVLHKGKVTMATSYGSVCELRLPPVCVFLRISFPLILLTMTFRVNVGDTSKDVKKGYWITKVSCRVFQHLPRRSLMDAKAAAVMREVVLVKVVLVSNISGEYISPASTIWGTTV